MKHLLATLLVTSSLLLTGCNGETTEVQATIIKVEAFELESWGDSCMSGLDFRTTVKTEAGHGKFCEVVE